MVYGLNIQPEWGFSPKAEWEGQKEPAKPIPALNPVDDGGVTWSHHHSGYPVDGTNFPKWVRWRCPSGKPVPDFDSVPYLNVSERAKSVIESLEPGVHQFFPVEYQDGKGNFTAIRYWFVPCNRIDSVDREHSNMVLRKELQWSSPKNILRLGESLPPNVDPTKPAKYVFSLAAIGNRHIWRDKHIGGATCFLSDAMAELFKREGLTGLRLDESRADQI